jgi:hypothetical protein
MGPAATCTGPAVSGYCLGPTLACLCAVQQAGRLLLSALANIPAPVAKTCTICVTASLELQFYFP